MLKNAETLAGHRVETVSVATPSVTLPLRALEDAPLIRQYDEVKIAAGIELRFETPRPLFWQGNCYGYHWSCVIRHHVIGQNAYDAWIKAEQWAQQFVEVHYAQSTEVSGSVINT